ncbi:uncharacterized protein ACA1_349470 [Acanthamoeba castellanii str. Neff]|uniref:Uncharacterized protein n=1 Tax=Acanthamoeba castellanii (strain ATCC 30010 / Neff) TaxID=1257118 RepID=L8GLS8_ACACF|nr:uncharacterized protein ACA1_349470 [Acanthamoeba castellanii str. Neff]ELR13146.1 hypothetical protein ACA1_349470 [Acanthamoeba castellanii str. Neff]
MPQAQQRQRAKRQQHDVEQPQLRHPICHHRHKRRQQSHSISMAHGGLVTGGASVLTGWECDWTVDIVLPGLLAMRLGHRKTGGTLTNLHSG